MYKYILIYIEQSLVFLCPDSPVSPGLIQLWDQNRLSVLVMNKIPRHHYRVDIISIPQKKKREHRPVIDVL